MTTVETTLQPRLLSPEFYGHNASSLCSGNWRVLSTLDARNPAKTLHSHRQGDGSPGIQVVFQGSDPRDRRFSGRCAPLDWALQRLTLLELLTDYCLSQGYCSGCGDCWIQVSVCRLLSRWLSSGRRGSLDWICFAAGRQQFGGPLKQTEPKNIWDKELAWFNNFEKVNISG